VTAAGTTYGAAAPSDSSTTAPATPTGG
jgi:hypothetical protein